MLRKLLATTALVAVMAAPGFAADGTENRAGTITIYQGATISNPDSQGYLTSNLMGKSVYTTNADDAERIGEIDDMLVDAQGQVTAVIVGVGGFLGMGEKDVAIDFSRLTIEKTGEDADDYRLISDATKDELEQTAAFERDLDEDDAMRTAATDTQTSTETGAAQPTAQATDGTQQNAAADQPTDESGTAAAQTDDAQARDEYNTAKWTDKDRSFYDQAERLDAKTISTTELVGLNVYGVDRSSVGEVGDIILKPEGDVDAVIIDVGGFLGMGEKPVAVDFKQINVFRDKNGKLTVMAPFTEDELKKATPFDEKNFESKRDVMLLGQTR